MARISPLAAHGARIKELYIELENYAFFHGPSQVNQIDRRFTGRREVLDRLKSLLTDHESLAGAYLVTGFRGAGKSSLVAKALSEITPASWGAISARRVLRIVSPVLCLALIPGPIWPAWATPALALGALFFLGSLVGTDPDRFDRLPKARRRHLKEWWESALRALVLRPELPKASRFRTLLRDAVAILSLAVWSRFLFAAATFIEKDHLDVNRLIHRLLLATLAASIYIGLIPLVGGLQGSEGRMRRFWRRLRLALSTSGRLQVKINLSQDNLREIDILRSIASSLEAEFRRFARLSVGRIFIRFLLILPFLIISFFLYKKVLGHWAQDVKHDLHIACLFPSQGRYSEDTETSGRRYRAALMEHREGHRVGSTDLRRILHQSLLETWGANDHGLAHSGSESLFGRLYESAFLVTTAVDTLVQVVTHTILSDVMRIKDGPQAAGRPFVLDYGLLLFIALGWLVPTRLLRWSLFDRPSHRDILRQLRELNEMIDSEVTHEKGGAPFQATSLVSLSFSPRRRQTFRNLNEREIEKRLIEILRYSQQISPLEIRPEFIVVFDELDKIQHTPVAQTSGLQNGTEDAVSESRIPDLGLVEVVERNRQHRILSLVSNLKHFLSTAPAKFIFIAGREMFDAALADVSDRHFFMGSVFNEVLHVPSFHSDDTDDRLPDISSLPEEVLCRFLLPPDSPERPSLASYRRWLEKELIPEGSCPPELLDQQRNKVMYELQNFVTYLTYRSNGAPKRITATLERFIVQLPQEMKSKQRGNAADEHVLVVGRSNSSLYLRFRYPDQYTFGLVTYLASPLIFSVNRAIKDYGDKILVSSSFVLDHIFKFHGHGFSWRNLELLPDVVDINRAPQLRELISHIMRFLARGHINEIISGLYHFKFTRRISEEISILSKLSEHESAAFNFTLDESLNLKRRFYRQLHRLLETQARYPQGWAEDYEFVNSVAFLRMILGDLHYYDGEYDSAIVEYMEAVQQLRRLRQQERGDTLILMIRNFLKLGLAFERKKTFDSALVTYGRIAAIAARFGKEHIHAIRRQDPEARQGPSDQLDPVTVEGIRLIYQPMFARLQLIEKATLGGISESDLRQVEKEFTAILSQTQQGERFLATSEYFNKVGDILFFKNGPMPSADRVYCQSRHRRLGRLRTTPGRTRHPLKRVLDLVSGSEPAEAPREAKVQLCFENPHLSTLVGARRRLPCRACGSYNSALLVLCEDFLEIPRRELARPGVALVEILRCIEPKRGASARKFADRKNFLQELGDVLSDLGDTYLSCAFVSRPTVDESSTLPIVGGGKAPAPEGIPSSALKVLIRLLREDRVELVEPPSGEMAALVKIIRSPEESPNVKLLEAMAYFAAAAIVFRGAAHHRAASIQIIKLLWLLREFLALTRGIGLDWEKKDIEHLARLCIRELHRSHEGTHRLEIESIKEVLDPTLDGRARDKAQVDLSRLSINANISEVLVLQKEIEMRLPDRAHGPKPLNDLCSPHSMFPSVYSRIHALRLRGGLHNHNLRIHGLGEALDGFKQTRSDLDKKKQIEARVEKIDLAITKLGGAASDIVPHSTALGEPREAGVELLEMMLIDAAYCSHEIIRLVQIYGRTYMASHSMKAAAHAALATWCNHIFAYIRYRNVRNEDPKKVTDDLDAFQKSLEQAIGVADMVHVSPNYHREMALLHWRAAAETHTEGRAYQELLEDMFYLNDDFSDFLEHFCAALERLRLNSGSIDKKIQATTHELALTSIYNPKNYFARRPNREEEKKAREAEKAHRKAAQEKAALERRAHQEEDAAKSGPDEPAQGDETTSTFAEVEGDSRQVL